MAGVSAFHVRELSLYSEFCFWDLRFGRIVFFRAYWPIGFFGEGMVVFWGDVAVVLIILCTFVAKLQI